MKKDVKAEKTQTTSQSLSGHLDGLHGMFAEFAIKGIDSPDHIRLLDRDLASASKVLLDTSKKGSTAVVPKTETVSRPPQRLKR
jgi:hypothetical protein